jgi:hypothetical protein
MRRWLGDHAPRSRVVRWLLGLFVAWLLLLLLIKLAGPSLIETIVEKSLSDMPGGYRGTVERVELRMLRAEVALHGMQIEKKNGQVPLPYMKTQLVMGTVADGLRPRTTLSLIDPVINIVDAPSEEAKQTGPKMELAKVREQLPFELITLRIQNAEIHFRNYQPSPPLDAYVTRFNLTWEKLVGCMPPGTTSCRSRVQGKGALMKNGGFAIKGTFERLPEPTFEARTSIRNLHLAQLSPLLKHYAKIDLQRGTVDVDGKLRQRGDRKSAFLVPRLENVDVMGGDGEDTSFFRELGAAAAAGWFERKSGKKAISIVSAPGKKTDFNLVDLTKDDD